jgi:hypothetical protein
MKKKQFVSIGLVFWTCIFCSTLRISADEPITILIFPFQINSQGDHSFLQPAVMDMLYTRLADKNRMIIIEDTSTSSATIEQNAILTGIQQKAHFAVIGHLEFTADTVNTDARFLDIASQKPLVVFSRFGYSQDALIEHIDLFSTRIKEEVFGQVPSNPPNPFSVSNQEDVYIHPEKLNIPENTPAPPLKKRKLPEPVVPDR